MIVRSVPVGLLLITQPDHAHLAGRIMLHCTVLSASPRRDAILRAIAEHDNGWAVLDASPIVNPATGGVADFINVPVEMRQAVWPRGVEALADQPWAAALVAQHAITVYDRFRSDAEWTPFFAEMAALRDAMLRASEMPLDDLVADYRFVRLGDLISLSFCTGWSDAHRFGEWTVQLSGTTVTVAPDPFGGAQIPMEIAARALRRPTFGSDAELRSALSEARVTTVRASVVGTTLAW